MFANLMTWYLGGFENLLPHISTMEAFQDIIQTDSGSYNAGLQLLFF